MGLGVAENPAASVHVHDDWQHARGTPRLDDPYSDVARWGRDRDPLLIYRRLADRDTGLRVFQDLPRIGRRHLVEEWRLRKRVSDLLCCRLEDSRIGSRHDEAPHASLAVVVL